MAKVDRLTIERLKEVLDYDSKTGVFTWKLSRRGCRKGSVAGNHFRYRTIRIDQVDYQAARLAWFWVYGVWPRLVRFQNGKTDDLRIDNLRDGFYLETKYDHKTKEGKAAYMKEYRTLRYDERRDQQMRKRFGIGLDEYMEIHQSQNGLCAICGNPETAKRNGKERYLAIDHCHSTGKIRGLLCGSCNPMIGYAKDDVEVLKRAIKYLGGVA